MLDAASAAAGFADLNFELAAPFDHRWSVSVCASADAIIYEAEDEEDPLAPTD